MRTTEKIILGTAQLGLDYGINNAAGQPGREEAINIFDIAQENGICLLDTAEAYGDAINLIAQYHQKSNTKFQIISKFKFSAKMDLVENVRHTNELLKIDSLYAYLLHNGDRISENEMEDQFGSLKNEELINYSGVSIYTNAEFEKAIEADYIDIIQLPYNLLDNDFYRGNLISKAKSKGKIIHTRSVFLQGLFFMDPENLPTKLAPLKNYIVAFNMLCEKYSIKKVSAALQYVLRNRDIDGVLVGVDSASQLTCNINAAQEEIKKELLEKIDRIRVQEIELLNPVNWN